MAADALRPSAVRVASARSLSSSGRNVIVGMTTLYDDVCYTMSASGDLRAPNSRATYVPPPWSWSALRVPVRA
jgi:hypothetical protein